MLRSAILAGMVVLAGCMDEPEVKPGDTSSIEELEDAEVTLAPDDEFAALTENGAVKMGLTSERVYFEASPELRRYIDREIAEGMAQSDSRVGRAISSAVRRGVQGALEIDMAYRLEEISDVDYRNGELVFEFVDPDDARALDNIELDDEPITRAFEEDDAEAFVSAFRRVKAGESIRGEAIGSKEAETVENKSTSTPDSAGGGSF